MAVQPFVRGVVLSEVLVTRCDAVREQLQLLLWGGLRVAVLGGQGEGGGSPQQPEPQADPDPAAKRARTAYPDGVDLLTPQPASACEQQANREPQGQQEGQGEQQERQQQGEQRVASVSPSGPAASKGEPLGRMASWAARHGLSWPGEVLLCCGREEEEELTGRLGAGEAAPEVLSHVVAGEEEAGQWARLRLTLAHINLRRAEHQQQQQQEQQGQHSGGDQGQAQGGAAAGAGGAPPLVVVGYVMKASRERDLAQCGLLGLVPQDGLVFAPLRLESPLASQLPFHALLHKASDELVYDSGDGNNGNGNGCRTPRFGPAVGAMAAFAAAHPLVAVVDPLEAAAKVINRTELAACVADSLARLGAGVEVGEDEAGDAQGEQAQGEEPGEGPREGLRRPTLVAVRAPRSVTVESFSEEEVAAAVRQLGCPPPYIVKPVVACGTADSHSMALVLWAEALAGLPLPLPAVVQEFVNHDALIHKVYVAGDKVFFTTRPSIPNVPRTRADASALRSDGVLLFDSLKSLPTRLPEAAAAAGAAATGPDSTGPVTNSQCATRATPRVPSQHVFERIAASLHQSLGLSLFGFDVVIAAEGDTPGDAADAQAGMDGQCQAGAAPAGGCEGLQGQQQQRGQQGVQQADLQYVVVDVNYFPSFKGAPGAAQLFREAVMAAYRRHVAGAGGGA